MIWIKGSLEPLDYMAVAGALFGLNLVAGVGFEGDGGRAGLQLLQRVSLRESGSFLRPSIR